MGDDASSGVVDSFGNVFRANSGNVKYDGLYVVDGWHLDQQSIY